MTTTQDSEQDGTEVEQQQKIIAACRDCGYVHADKVDDYQDVRGSEDGPAFRHYDATGHNVGLFEPTDGSLLDDQWEIAYGLATGDLRDASELFELATGVPADD